MYPTVYSEVIFFVFSFAAGSICAFLYDLIRISRRIVAVNTSAVGIQDILFFASAAVLIFFAAYEKNKGELRLWGLLSGIWGAGLYFFLIRNRFVNLGTTAVKWLIKSGLWFVSIILFPFRLILRALKKPISIIIWYTGQKLKKVKRRAKGGKRRLGTRLRAARIMLRKK